MKNRSDYTICSSPQILAAALLLMLASGSCKSDEEIGLIPEKTFATILTEVHLSDGLLMLPEIRDRYYGRDTSANYTDIIESHGYTKEAMDRTLKYYFTEKPRRLIRIYDHAIGRLTEIETFLVEETEETLIRSGDLWKGKPIYYLFEEPESEKIYFDHIFYPQGAYTIQFSLIVYPSDQSFNPCFTAWTCHADSADTGKRNYFPSMKYIKDGQPHTYIMIFNHHGKSPVILKGWLYDSENFPAGVSRHAKIENISFLFTPGTL